jgi:hypothetical protein
VNATDHVAQALMRFEHQQQPARLDDEEIATLQYWHDWIFDAIRRRNFDPEEKAMWERLRTLLFSESLYADMTANGTAIQRYTPERAKFEASERRYYRPYADTAITAYEEWLDTKRSIAS